MTKNQNDGLYLLQDGTHADSGDVAPGNDGVLRHKNGMAVCLYADGRPQTIGEDAERNKNVEAAKVGVDKPAVDVAPPIVADSKVNVGEPEVALAPHEPKAG